MKTLFGFLAASAALGLSIGAMAGSRTINDGVYTEEQADIGEELYEKNCLTCHDKKYFRPVLKTWEGQPLGVLFTVMSASMPESNPGSLPRSDYVEILAYILSLSRYPAGEERLDHENDALNDITIAARK